MVIKDAKSLKLGMLNMATILLAKSLETNQIVTAPEADAQRGLGLIKSKHLFECIDDKCNAQITCANLLKAASKRKKEPYFIYVSDHSESCKEKEKIEIIEREQQKNLESNSRKYLSEKYAFFNFDVVSTKKVETISIISDSSTPNVLNDTNSSKEPNHISTRPSKKTLSAWVKLFKDESSNISAIYNNEEIYIRDLFVNIDTIKNIDELEEEPRIYYGKAWIHEQDKGINFRFNQKIQFGELLQRPNLMLFDNKIKDEPLNGRFSKKTLLQLSQRKNANNTKIPIILYILSDLPPHLSKNGKFINFFAKSLRHVYYTK